MVSTTGMVVSLKTDLRFPESGQQGHGARIIHFYERPYNGEDIAPYVYDGNMSVEDYELMHRLMEQNKERSERVNEVFSIQLHNHQLYEQGKDGV